MKKAISQLPLPAKPAKPAKPSFLGTNQMSTTTKPKLPPGPHPGFQNLKSQPGVYRAKLWPVINKDRPEHADCSGILQLTGSKAQVYIWVHQDGSLGLRLEKITK
jgi:hypothetical protein